MRKILILLVIGLIFSCSDSKQGIFWEENRVNINVLDNKLQILEHEGCEYLIYTAYEPYAGYGFGMHKGNCKNPIHECN